MAKLREREKRDEVCLLVCVPRTAAIEALIAEDLSSPHFADDDNEAIGRGVEAAIQSLIRKHSP
jgi:hypothetical protein